MRAYQHRSDYLETSRISGGSSCGLVALPGLRLADEARWPACEKGIVEETLDNFEGAPLSADEGDRRFGAIAFAVSMVALFVVSFAPVL